VVHDGHEVEAGFFGRLRLLDHTIEQPLVGDARESEVGHVKPEHWIHTEGNRPTQTGNSVTTLSDRPLAQL